MFAPSKRELLRMIERERAQHRLEVAALLDRLAALSGQPWTLPPRPVEPIDADAAAREQQRLEWLETHEMV